MTSDKISSHGREVKHTRRKTGLPTKNKYILRIIYVGQNDG